MRFFSRLAAERVYQRFPSDYFKTTLYTGNATARSIVNGLRMNAGGMVLTYRRNSPLAGVASDTMVPAQSGFYFGSNADRAVLGSPTSFNEDGYTIGASDQFNASGGSFVSWAFRCAPRFFDVVRYTSNGSSEQLVPHRLGQYPGLILLRPLNGSSRFVGSRGAYRFTLGGNAADNIGTPYTNISKTNSSVIAVDNSGNGLSAASGTDVIAYLFANDTSIDGVIRSGEVSTNSSGSGFVNFGWPPQFLLLKNIYDTGDWEVFDTTRGWKTGEQRIIPLNGSAYESPSTANIVMPTATGFSITGGWTDATLRYVAIRSGPTRF